METGTLNAVTQRARGRQLSRRSLLRGAAFAAAGAGSALLFGCSGNSRTAEARGPEVTTIRLAKDYSICLAPQWVAREFLLEEGFTNVEYHIQGRLSEFNGALAAGDIDMSLNFVAPVVASIDKGEAITALGGVHVGCVELFVHDGITSVEDLRGKRVAVAQTLPTEGDLHFIENLMHYVGVSPEWEIDLRVVPLNETVRMFQKGEVDAVLAYPPMGEQFRTLGVGSVLASNSETRPWSGYYCCVPIVGNAFLERNPVATQRALRAILRGADLCASDPEYVARYLVEKGFTINYEYALASMRMVKYGVWRDFDPEDTMRFYALRLSEAGSIHSTPDEIIERGTNWTMFDALKEEMAAASLPGFSPPAAAINCEIDLEHPVGA